MPENALLQSLPDDERTLITERSSLVHFSALQRLHRAGEPVEHVYFPCSGLISLQMVAQDGRAIETGLVDREGLVGGDAIRGGAILTVTLSLKPTAMRCGYRRG